MGELTPKHQTFVDEYLVDLNGTAAAIRAGYSESRARQTACDLLARDDIQEAIAAAFSARAARTKVDQDYVVEKLRTVVERCLQAEPVTYRNGEPVETETEDGVMARAYTFNASGANGALGLLAKHTGGFSDKLEHTGKNGAPLPTAAVTIFALPDNGR
jgi:phage terminase small subunit